MNIYWTGGLLASFIVWSGACALGGYKYEGAKCAAGDEKHDLAQSQNTMAAQTKVLGVVENQGNISQEASKEYATDYANIIALYTSGMSVPPAGPVNRVPAVRNAAAGTCPAVHTESKVYRLTPQQCDTEEAKCNALWNWATRQALAGGKPAQAQ